MPATKVQALLQNSWRKLMSDYVTAIAWAPNGAFLAACSACGEVVLYDAKTGMETELRRLFRANLPGYRPFIEAWPALENAVSRACAGCGSCCG